MIKLYRYELKRLVCNKFFVGALAVTLFYGYLVLSGDVVQGIAHTAPFSAWSFGYYLARVLPLVCVGELFFLTFYTSRVEQRVAELTAATPVNRSRYLLLRSGAVLTGTAVIALCAVALGVGFCIRLFGAGVLKELAAPTLLVLIPAAAFCLGVGWLAGKLHPAALYAVMAAVFLLSWAPLPMSAGFSMLEFFRQWPLELGTLDPSFSVPAGVWAGRAVYTAVGVAALWAGCFRSGGRDPAGKMERG